MAIRLKVKADITPIKGASELLSNMDNAMSAILETVTQTNINKYLRPMEQIDPGPSRHRGRWSTDPGANPRARRWFFANYPNGYTRTGELNRKWRIVVRGKRLSLENNARGARYVFTMAKNIRARGGRPNPGHIDTGWPQEGQRVAREVLDMVIEDVSLAHSRSLMASMSNGRYTIVTR